jgi:hypothetical protein
MRRRWFIGITRSDYTPNIGIGKASKTVSRAFRGAAIEKSGTFRYNGNTKDVMP